MKIKLKDKVIILSGKDKGKQGLVKKVLPEVRKVIVEGVNIVKKHVKPGAMSKEGGIITFEKPIDASNVAILNSETGKADKVGFKIVDGKKYRIYKKTGQVIEQK